MDGYSFPPITPAIDLDESMPEPNIDPIDKGLSEAYFHPAWGEVVKMFNEELESLSQAVDPKLPSEEYKCEDLANKKAIATVVRILGRIEDAVRAVESIERKPNQGGK